MIQSSLFHVQNRTGQYVCMNYQIGAGAQISSRFKFGDNLTMHTGSSSHRFPCLFIFIFNFSCLYLYSPRCLIHSIELSLSSRSTRRDHGSQPECLCFWENHQWLWFLAVVQEASAIFITKPHPPLPGSRWSLDCRGKRRSQRCWMKRCEATVFWEMWICFFLNLKLAREGVMKELENGILRCARLAPF